MYSAEILAQRNECAAMRAAVRGPARLMGNWVSMLRKAFLGALAFVVLAAAISISSAKNACAHDPRFACSPRAANPIRIPDAWKSWAYYGHLGPGQTDVYRFAVSKPLRVPWNVLLDRRDVPTPGRPAATIADRAGHVIARANLDHPKTFYEPFSRERYLTSPDQVLHLAPGSYEVRVSMAGASHSQRYTLAIGEAEKFSPLELPYVIGAILRIRAQHY